MSIAARHGEDYDRSSTCVLPHGISTGPQQLWTSSCRFTCMIRASCESAGCVRCSEFSWSTSGHGRRASGCSRCSRLDGLLCRLPARLTPRLERPSPGTAGGRLEKISCKWGTFEDHQRDAIHAMTGPVLLRVDHTGFRAVCFVKLRVNIRYQCHGTGVVGTRLSLVRFLHERRIAYLDLKGQIGSPNSNLLPRHPVPAGENCLIDQHGYLKIIDFGVAERVPGVIDEFAFPICTWQHGLCQITDGRIYAACTRARCPMYETA